MKLNAFKDSLSGAEPPPGLGGALRALWLEAKGDWAGAHASAQDDKSEAGAWVHAYLHRVEGDLSNAGYWYRQAGKPKCDAPLAEEWQAIAAALCEG